MNHSKLTKIVVAGILTVGIVFLFHTSSKADENQDLKDQVKALQQKVGQLEKQLAAQSSAPMPTAAALAPQHAVIYNQIDPWQQMRNMERQMNQMMKESTVDFNPHEDVKVTPDAYIISMDIPGMNKDKINLEIKQGNLIVSGVRESEVKQSGPDHFYRQERSFGNFLRTVPLPDDAKTDKIDAQYNNGVLVVKVDRNKAANTATATQKIKIK